MQNRKEERASCKVFGNYLHTYYYDKSIADGYTLKIIREDIETSYKERLSDVYDKLETLVQKKDIRKSEIIEHPSYVNELARYIMTDLKEFRKIQGDDTLGGMVICETSEQARRLYDVFQEEWQKYQPKPIKIKLSDACLQLVTNHSSKSIFTQMSLGMFWNIAEHWAKFMTLLLKIWTGKKGDCKADWIGKSFWCVV